MRQLFFALLFFNCFLGFSTIKPPNKKDPCSECYTDPGKNDSIYYLRKIDSLSKLITNWEKESSEIFRLRGDYYACLAKYKHNMDSVFIKPAFADLHKAISIDSSNWRAFRTLISLYVSEMTFEKKQLELALKYANLLVKYNDANGDSYFTRALISILLNKLDSTESDLIKAEKYNPCEYEPLIETYKSIYYLMSGKYSLCCKIVNADYMKYEFFNMFVGPQLLTAFPNIRSTIFAYLKQNSNIDKEEKYFLISLLKDSYRINNLDIKEIEDLK